MDQSQKPNYQLPVSPLYSSRKTFVLTPRSDGGWPEDCRSAPPLPSATIPAGEKLPVSPCARPGSPIYVLDSAGGQREYFPEVKVRDQDKSADKPNITQATMGTPMKSMTQLYITLSSRGNRAV